jgi:hypothetical protein
MLNVKNCCILLRRNLMLSTWSTNATDRPTFPEIRLIVRNTIDSARGIAVLAFVKSNQMHCNFRVLNS